MHQWSECICNHLNGAQRYSFRRWRMSKSIMQSHIRHAHAVHLPNDTGLRESTSLSVALTGSDTIAEFSHHDAQHVHSCIKGVALTDACVPVASTSGPFTCNNNRVYLQQGLHLPQPATLSARFPDGAVQSIQLPNRATPVLALTQNITNNTLGVQLQYPGDAPNLPAMFRAWEMASNKTFKLIGAYQFGPRTYMNVPMSVVTWTGPATFLIALGNTALTVTDPDTGVTQPFATSPVAAIMSAVNSASFVTPVLPGPQALARVLQVAFVLDGVRVRVFYNHVTRAFTVSASTQLAKIKGSHAPHHSLDRVFLSGSLMSILNLGSNALGTAAGQQIEGTPFSALSKDTYVTLDPDRAYETALDVADALNAAFAAQRVWGQPPVVGSTASLGLGAFAVEDDGTPRFLRIFMQLGSGTNTAVDVPAGSYTLLTLVAAINDAIAAEPAVAGVVASAHAAPRGVAFTAPGQLTVSFVGGTPVAASLGYAPSDTVLSSLSGAIAPSVNAAHLWSGNEGYPLQQQLTASVLCGTIRVNTHTQWSIEATVNPGPNIGGEKALTAITFAPGWVAGTRVLVTNAGGDSFFGVLRAASDGLSMVVYGNIGASAGDQVTVVSVEQQVTTLLTQSHLENMLPCSVLGCHYNAAFPSTPEGVLDLPYPPTMLPPPYLFVELFLGTQNAGDVLYVAPGQRDPKTQLSTTRDFNRFFAVLVWQPDQQVYAPRFAHSFHIAFPSPISKVHQVRVRLLTHELQPYTPDTRAASIVVEMV